MANILGLVGVGVSGLALLFAILAMSLTYWETANPGGVSDVTIGIWEYCVETNGNKVCTTIDSDSVTDDEELRDYQGVRATVFLGIIFTTSAIVSAILVLFVLTTKNILYFVAAGIDVAAGLFLMIAMAVYAGGVAHDGYDLHACFALDIIAWLAAWVGGGFFVGAKLAEKQ
ncbi:uncharacterized protein LOC128548808 [Mercenaria mercenaria]|uniref:uncharacterized protein LOC128548808 n=1 Tax=Mercenaria mercenaria TaxID=6596 RepID=UPI00234EB52F|nr:uncharacterized protein LOC128548808 [Mercenaria mercenaria]